MRSSPALLIAAFSAACSSSSTSRPSDAGADASTGDGGTCATTGGPVSGAADDHCAGEGGAIAQALSAASCTPSDAAAAPDAGTTDYGDTLFNASGDDDDCKYHLEWRSAAICQGANVSFTVVVTEKASGKAPRSVPVRAEVFLGDKHPAPNTNQTSSETSTPGTYTVGPIRFDAPGKWTVRFHLHEECSDIPDDSPHGHAAFFVDVP